MFELMSIIWIVFYISVLLYKMLSGCEATEKSELPQQPPQPRTNGHTLTKWAQLTFLSAFVPILPEEPVSASSSTFRRSTCECRPHETMRCIGSARGLLAKYGAIVWISCDMCRDVLTEIPQALFLVRTVPVFLCSACARSSISGNKMTISVFGCFHKSRLTSSAASG